MNEQELIEQLKAEGFADLRVCPIPPTTETPAHTHDQHTVHIILSGELIVTDNEGSKTYKTGDRVEFPAGTTHQAKGQTDEGQMIVGIKLK